MFKVKYIAPWGEVYEDVLSEEFLATNKDALLEEGFEFLSITEA